MHISKPMISQANESNPFKKMKQISLILSILVLLSAFIGCKDDSIGRVGPQVDPDQLHMKPLSPEDAVKSFTVKPGFVIELVAAEPLVMDPMAMDFDERGVMYVVEMRYYPLIDTTGEKLGRIRRLVDTDGDGIFDQSSIFADQLRFPTAVICYDGGVFVANTPDLLYLKDTSGDGIADHRKTVMSGFGTKGHPAFFVQQMPNSFKWGLDNRIHAVTSGNGGSVEVTGQNTEDYTEISGQDFSFDPNTFELSKESGGMQHGMSFDDWGRKFITRQSSHIEQVMFDNAYADRNAAYAMPRSHVSIAEDGPTAEVYRISPQEAWRELRTKWTVEGLLVRDENMVLQWQQPGGERAVWQGGQGYDGGSFITSSSGITIYKGDAWPEKYRGSSFIAEPNGNLIHRDSLYIDAHSLQVEANRSKDELESDFLASTDNWFRPVQFANAPDGNLYIADMYREVIDLPSGIPDVIRQYFNLQKGNDKGRIYRIVPDDYHQPEKVNLGAYSVQELVKTLEHTNGWHQSTAARLLFQQQDQDAVPYLEELAKNSENPIGRMRAMYALDGLKALTPEQLLVGLDDKAGGVRRHAIKLSEQHFNDLDGTNRLNITQRWMELVKDPEKEVQYQLAFSMEKLEVKERIIGLKEVFLQNDDNRWVHAAILSSLSEGGLEMFESLVSEKETNNKNTIPVFLESLTSMIGTQNDPAIVDQLILDISDIQEKSEKFSLIVSLGKGMRRAKANLNFDANPQLSHLLDLAAITLDNPSAEVSERTKSIQLIGLSGLEQSKNKLIPLLDAGHSTEISQAAFETLSSFDDIETTSIILGKWNVITPSLRPRMFNYFLGRTDRIELLLKEMEADKISSKLLTSNQIRFLRSHSEPSIKSLAMDILPDVSGERQSIIDSYMAVLNMEGNSKAGMEVFRLKCSICHQMGDVGSPIGPNLATLGSRRAKLLVDIIDPNRDVSPDYLYNTVETLDGENLTGIISAETSNSITLTNSSGDVQTILRSNIKSITNSEFSLMPQGLEEDLSIEEMADLLTFIERSGS